MRACRPRLSVDYPPSTIIQGYNVGKNISYLRALGVAEALTAPTAAAIGVGALGAARPAGAASGDGRVLLCQTAQNHTCRNKYEKSSSDIYHDRHDPDGSLPLVDNSRTGIFIKIKIKGKREAMLAEGLGQRENTLTGPSTTAGNEPPARALIAWSRPCNNNKNNPRAHTHTHTHTHTHKGR